ncbi:hypothetical protein HaLaN_12443 [Haematococcus lacustris]|uniref:Uncharacterized protein n=1 Tax=Haematococcus lacustris TaxID=44745 RepID=A0A699Z223_HAELA|nr:hypothetical protein HaLaN_12443 [Haematococcus lacustris]
MHCLNSQVVSIRVALIVGTAVAGAILALGLLVWAASLKRIPIHVLDCTVLLVLVVQLGISYREEDAMQRVPPDPSEHAGGSPPGRLAPPPGQQYCRGHHSCAHCSHDSQHAAVPVALDVWRDNSAPTTILFKVLTPCLSTSAALLAVRLWPSFSITPHLQASQGFDALPGGARMLKHCAADPLAV